MKQRDDEERSVKRELYDWTFRAFLRKGRVGTRVLLAKTKERRLDGAASPLETRCRAHTSKLSVAVLFMRRSAEKDVSRRGQFRTHIPNSSRSVRVHAVRLLRRLRSHLLCRYKHAFCDIYVAFP